MAVDKNREKQEQDVQEELAFLRQKLNSLTIRGHYSECAKAVEDNLKMLYFQDRWPENLIAVLRTLQKCYPSLNHSQPFEEYLRQLLRKNGVPVVYADLLRSGEDVRWNAEYFRELSVEHKEKEQFEEALGYCDLALKTSSINSSLYLLRGWILDDMGRDAEALAMYEKSLEMNQGNFQASQAIAAHYAKTKPDKAIAYIDKAIKLNPREARYYEAKGSILEGLGRRDEASACYEKASEMDPEEADYPYRAAELLYHSGQRETALPLYRRAVAIQKTHLPSLTRLASLLTGTNNTEALGYADTAYHLDPENKTAGLIRAELLRKTGDFPAAIRQYNRVLRLDEKSAEALAGLGYCTMEEDPAQAAEHFGAAVALAPQEADYHMGRGMALEALEERERAAESYKKVVALRPESLPAHARLGHLFKETKPDLALKHFEKAIQLDPKNAECRAEKAYLLFQMGKGEQAVAFLDTASQSDPGNPQLHIQMGDLMRRMGNQASAITHYKSAIHLDPYQAEGFYGLCLLTLSTTPQEALIYIDRAMHLVATNPEYYAAKSQVMFKLHADPFARQALRDLLDNEERKEEPDESLIQELEEVMEGAGLRLALLYINRAIELGAYNSGYLCTRAGLLADLGQPGKAMDQFNELLKKAPDNHEALYGLGRILAGKGEEKQALEHLDRAIALAPDNARYHNQRAACLARNPERYREALESYGRAIALDTFSWEYLLAKAKLLDTGGEHWEAMEFYRRTLLVYPNCTEAVARLGRLLAHDHPLVARHYLETAAKLEEKDWLHRAWLARICYALEETTAAETACREAMALGGQNADTALTLARILSGADLRAALKYALLSSQLAPEQADSHLLLGEIYMRLGDYAQAEEHYRRGAELDPQNTDAWLQEAELLYRKGDPAVLEVLDTVLEKKPDMVEGLWLRARVLAEMEEPPQLAEAINSLTHLLKLAPDRVEARERLVELLYRKKAYPRWFLEKRKLEQQHKRRREAEERMAALATTQGGAVTEAK